MVFRVLSSWNCVPPGQVPPSRSISVGPQAGPKLQAFGWKDDCKSSCLFFLLHDLISEATRKGRNSSGDK